MAQYRKDWIERWTDYLPEKIAVKEYGNGRTLTYKELNQKGARAASFLTQHLGLTKGSRIAMLADFSLEYAILLSAAQKTGIVLVPLNYRLATRELAYMLDDCTPGLFMVDDHYLPLLEGHESLGKIRHVMKPDTFLQAIEETPGVPFPPAPIAEDDPLLILYTSGTTGFPKGALYTHGMAFWNSINTATRLDITSADHTLVCMPPFHTGGWNVLFTPFLHHGASVTLMKKFDAAGVLNTLEQEKATLFMAVPTMLKMMSDDPAFDHVSLQSIRYFIVGGEPLPIPTIERWHNKGVLIRQGYGLTEVGPNVTSLHHSDAVRKKGSIGKPNFYVDYRVVADDGTDCSPSQAGELWLKGPMVTPGYWQNPSATAAALQDGWFKTGDVVQVDPEGYIYIVDRKKNMYISGGENVYPAEVEHFLRTHPHVEEVAVVGVPDPKWGETGKVFIALKEGAMLTGQEVIQFCNGKLAKYKVPKHVVFMDELPKNAAGKIARKELE
ncbi:class I adenylate-forming enzyme family protein [Roseivirga sp. BDSF3-8]|uniref:class I adenylate-forming enzyme family protein n=1 Tax=Roseivirga sp. BDSF3-8 TaxID=3241598 RepID=UPI003531B1E2